MIKSDPPLPGKSNITLENSLSLSISILELVKYGKSADNINPNEMMLKTALKGSIQTK
jgi:hypothetical protein